MWRWVPMADIGIAAENDRRRRHAAVGVAGGVELAHPVRCVGREKHGVGEKVHRQPANPAEEKAVAQQHGALLVAGGELRRQGRAGHLEQRGQRADHDGGRNRVEEQRRSAPVRRVPQGQVGERKRSGGGIHERVTPPPGTAEVVRELPDQWVDAGVEQQCDERGQGDRLGRDAHHLIVEEYQEVAEAVVLHPEGDRAETVEPAGRAIDFAAGLDSGAAGTRRRLPPATPPTLDSGLADLVAVGIGADILMWRDRLCSKVSVTWDGRRAQGVPTGGALAIAVAHPLHVQWVDGDAAPSRPDRALLDRRPHRARAGGDPASSCDLRRASGRRSSAR